MAMASPRAATARSTPPAPFRARSSRATSPATGSPSRRSSRRRRTACRRPARTTAAAAAATCSTPPTPSSRTGARRWFAGRWPGPGSPPGSRASRPRLPNTRRRAALSGRRTRKGAQVGFHVRGSDQVVEIPDCHVLDPVLLRGAAAAGTGHPPRGRARRGGDAACDGDGDGHRPRGGGGETLRPGGHAGPGPARAGLRAHHLERRDGASAGAAGPAPRRGPGHAAAGRVPAGHAGGAGGARRGRPRRAFGRAPRGRPLRGLRHLHLPSGARPRPCTPSRASAR